MQNTVSSRFRTSRARPHHRLCIESLEDRRLLAVVWDRVEPLGSLIYQSHVDGQLVSGSLSETTSLPLESGQTLSAVIQTDNMSAGLSAMLRDPSGATITSTTASQLGGTLSFQNVAVLAGGTYQLEVTGNIAASYDLSLIRNASVEFPDTEDGSEMDISPSYIAPGASRFGVIGRFDGSGGATSGVPTPVVWAIQPSSGEFLQLNPTNGSLYGSFPAPDALAPNHVMTGLSRAENGNSLLYVNGDGNGNDLYRLNPMTGAVQSVETLPGFGPYRAGLSYESEGPSIFAIDNGGPVDQQAGFGGSLTDWTPGGISFPGALGGDDHDRLFVVQYGQIVEYATTSVNTFVQAMPLPSAAQGAAGLAFDGVYLYLSDMAGNLFTIDPGTGQTVNHVVISGGPLTGLGAGIVDSSDLVSTGVGGADTDEYLVDLTGMAGDSIDVALSAQGGAAPILLEMLDVDGVTVLATGQTDADNFDVGITDFVVPQDGIYTLRTSSIRQANYAVVVTDSYVFDTETTAATATLRSLDVYDGALGHLDGADPTGDRYRVSMVAGQQLFLLTETPFDGTGENGLDPSIQVLNPTGQLVASDLDSSPDGKNALLTFTAPVAGTYEVVVTATGSGEYALHLGSGPTVGRLSASADRIWESEAVSISGSYSDRALTESHLLEVHWDDPNAANSLFSLPTIGSLQVGDTFTSSSDTAVLEVTTVDLQAFEVGFDVVEHVYLNDGPAPGNRTFQDTSTIVVSVTNSIGLVAFPETQDYVLNGGFETGDFTSWTVSGFGDGQWTINDGTTDPPGPGQALAPIAGGYDAMSLQTDGGVVELSQIVTLPANISSAVLSWTDRVRHFSTTGFVQGQDDYRLHIVEPNGSGNGIYDLFATLPGDPPLQVGPNQRSLDLTATLGSYEEEDVEIVFSNSFYQDSFNVNLDDVRLVISTGVDVVVRDFAPSIRLFEQTSPVNENEVVTMTGVITDPGILDQRKLIVDWDDPNTPVDSVFIIPPAASSFVGQIVPSTTDNSELIITDIDLNLGQVFFAVDHLFVDNPVTFSTNSFGRFGVTAEIFDEDAVNDSLVTLLYIRVDNVPPEVQLNPITEIFESDYATVTGSVIDPGILDEQLLVIDWDDPNDPVDAQFNIPAIASLSVGDVVGSATDESVLTITGVDVNAGQAMFVTDHQYADDGLAPGNGISSDVESITAIVQDDDGGTSTPATETVTVHNIQPELGPISVNASKDNKSEVGSDVVVTGSFIDIGLLDRHLLEVDWGDGAVSEFDVDRSASLVIGDQFASASGAILTITAVDLVTGRVDFSIASHQYATGGIFDIELRIDDDDQGMASLPGEVGNTQAWISGLRLVDGVLYVIGTRFDDHVTINRQGNGILKVHASFLQSGNFETFPLADVLQIVAYLCEGDDHMSTAGHVTIESVVHAGPDNDHVNAGGGPTVLLGDSGDDHLNGLDSRDILIGGSGEDRLVGGKGDDLLIGGTTTYDDDDDALFGLLAIWNQTQSYASRLAAIQAAFAFAVSDDEDDDRLTGSADQDLFYDGLGDHLTDVQTKKLIEQVL